MSIFSEFKDKHVLITGNTGLKALGYLFGLLSKGACIFGLADAIPTQPSLFDVVKKEKRLQHNYIDARSYEKVKGLLSQI